MKNKVYLGLVHGPVKNKRGEEVTTSVTNLDIHDIARSCRTYGLEQYLIITPILAQKELLSKILSHWKEETGLAYNPDRQDALQMTRHRMSIDEAIEKIKEQTGACPYIAVTGANFESDDGGFADLFADKKLDTRPILLLFGTGWGLTASIVESADFRLRPLFGCATDGYNHLSVRSAVAIYLDRLKQGL